MKSLRHRYTPRKDEQEFCPLSFSPGCTMSWDRAAVAGCPACSRAQLSKDRCLYRAQRTQGWCQPKHHTLLCLQLPGLLYNSTGVKNALSPLQPAQIDRRMVTWMLRECFQMPFQPPYHRYAQERWVYAVQRESVRALCHSRSRVYGSYSWKMEHSDFQLPSRHLCKGIHFFPICFRRMFLHMGNF